MKMNFNVHELRWTREPAHYTLSEDKIEIITDPYTDLWQRTDCKWLPHDGQQPDEE